MCDIEYFQLSHINNALLKGNEIRYSDMIKYMLDKLPNFALKLNIGIEKEIIVHRERTHIDIMVEQKMNSQISLPKIIIENKLKSLPNRYQLVNYSKKVLNDAVDTYKAFLRTTCYDGGHITSKRAIKHCNDFINYLNSIKFYILFPFNYDGYEDNQNGQFGFNISLDVKWGNQDVVWNPFWEAITYTKLGEILEKTEETEDHYLNLLKDDFSSLLKAFGQLTINEIDIHKSLDNNLNDGFDRFNKIGMDTIYKKIRAEQLARTLKDIINGTNLKVQIIHNWNLDEIQKGNLIISYNFSSSGQKGLFEIIKKLDNNDLCIIQVEGTELRKCLRINGDITQPYRDWLLDPYEFENVQLIFNPKKNDPFLLHAFDSETTFPFFYTKCDVAKRNVSSILEIMKTLIIESFTQKI